MKDEAVYSFDPETARLQKIASSLEGWAKELLSDYNLWTGCSIAREWQQTHGALVSQVRLMPKIPFVCGGQFELSNLVSIDAVKGMRSRASLARQIVDLPDGAQVEFEVID